MEASFPTDANSRDAAYALVQATAEAEPEHPAEGWLACLAAQTEQALQQFHVGIALLLSSKWAISFFLKDLKEQQLLNSES